MDVARPDIARKRRRRRVLYSAGGLAILVLITIGLSRLQPAAPVVENPWTDTVKRGEMLCQVHGNGTLVPEEILWIPTLNAGRVQKILVLPGAAVKADTVLVELSNPDVEQAAFDAEWQLKAAEADLANLRVQLDTARLNQQSILATAQANYSSAKLDFEVNDELAKAGLVPALTLKQAKTKAEELAKLLEIEQERLNISADATKAQLAAQQAKVEQYRAQLQLKRRQVDALKIRAGIDGVLQKLGDASATVMLQEGQQLAPGANVARVANPAKLKAEIKISETQAKDIALDQKALVDTRNGVIPGHVVRIDPAAQNGTRTVDVALDGPLPKGAVPDLSVDGTIELERLNEVMFVGRPVQGQPDSTVGIFKVINGGKEAVRVPVKLGRSSVSTIEIVEGLQVGDKVILSDMSAYDTHTRVRVN
ncbi:MAG TPA: HlyD family efflux transporter periplasmic adaptor subunit [Candidatus Angelobacter sp.]|nr:HlyD family efflux transporter periplasmic adaptor subunit [Candidatus Angelobacter sp.]